MPASADPTPARVNHNFVIHLQSCYRRPATGSESEKPATGFIPGKVFRPSLSAGMEERDIFTCQRVRRNDCSALVFVAPAAGQTQIVKAVLAALNLGNDVINCKGLPCVFDCRLAVYATATIHRCQLLTQGRGEMGAHGERRAVAGGMVWPRQRSSAAAWALRNIKRSASIRSRSNSARSLAVIVSSAFLSSNA